MISELDLIMTLNCNSRCMHCYFCTEEKATKPKVMTISDAKKYLSPLKKDFPKRIEIFGGEPFLYFKELEGIIKAIRSFNSKTKIYIITNGFWGGSYEQVNHILSVLDSLKVKEIILSVDHFHQKHINLTYIKNIIKASKRHNTRISTNSALLPKGFQSEFNDSTRRILKELKQYRDESSISYHYRFMFIGRAINLISKKKLPKKLNNQVCTEECGNSFLNPKGATIYPNGDVALCFYYKIGNANEKPINEILHDFDINNFKVLKILALEGTDSLLKFAKSKGYQEKNYIDKCHLCYDVRNFLKKLYPNQLV